MQSRTVEKDSTHTIPWGVQQITSKDEPRTVLGRSNAPYRMKMLRNERLNGGFIDVHVLKKVRIWYHKYGSYRSNYVR
jgi:hypothetical protein